jgi:hypothetical protein
MYTDGTKYTGNWRNNKKEGYGILAYSNGINIKGTYYNGVITYGEIEFPNGAVYIGNMKDFLMSGKGTMVYNDGVKIEASFLLDEICLPNSDDTGCTFCLKKGCDYNCEAYAAGICEDVGAFL